MPSGIFKPYAGVSTAILIFSKTGKGGTDNVWFYDMKSDGYSLDDKREDLGNNGDIDDIITRYKNLDKETERERTEQSFLVPVKEIVGSGSYDLSINRYKKTDYQAETYDHPSETIAKVLVLEEEILSGLKELEAMFK